jgi:hypothetical protein
MDKRLKMTEDKLYEIAMQCVKRSAEGCSCECNLSTRKLHVTQIS